MSQEDVRQIRIELGRLHARIADERNATAFDLSVSDERFRLLNQALGHNSQALRSLAIYQDEDGEPSDCINPQCERGKHSGPC